MAKIEYDQLKVGRKYKVELDTWDGSISFEGVLMARDEHGHLQLVAIGELDVITGKGVEIEEVMISG